MRNLESRIGNEEEDQKNKEKQDLWDKTIEDLDLVSDKLDQHIDAGIREAVAAFIVNEFPTRQSCGGHVEERFDKIIKIKPYVDIGFNEPKERFVGEQEIKNKIAKEYDILPDEIYLNDVAEQAYWNYIVEQKVPETPEYLENRKKNEGLQKQVIEILENFYKDREVIDDARISAKPIDANGCFRVSSERGYQENIAEEDLPKYQQELLGEQEEIRALTEFLRQKFFEQEQED